MNDYRSTRSQLWCSPNGRWVLWDEPAGNLPAWRYYVAEFGGEAHWVFVRPDEIVWENASRVPRYVVTAVERKLLHHTAQRV
jgi:hypothetical protein